MGRWSSAGSWETATGSGLLTGVIGSLVVLLGACGDGGPVNPIEPVASLSVSTSQVRIMVDDTVRILAQARNATGGILIGRAFEWQVDRADIASVDEAGLVTGRSTGLARVTVATGGRTGSVSVRVTSSPLETVSAVELHPATVAATVGDTVRLTAVAKNAIGDELEGLARAWASTSGEIASVDDGGLVTARTAGTAWIRVTVEEISDSTEVTVEPSAPTTSAIVGIAPTTIQAGWSDFTLAVRGSGFGSGSRVLWSGQPLETRLIDATEIHGTVTGGHVVLEGPVTIEVETTVQGVTVRSNAVVFTVVPRPALSVEPRVPGNSLFAGMTVRVDAVSRDQFGEVLPGRAVEWTSSDPTVAFVEAGLLRALRSGWVRLTVRDGSASAMVDFHVVEAPTADLVVTATVGAISFPYSVALAAGGAIERLLPPGSAGAGATITRDGSRIAFVAPAAGGGSQIHVVDRNGTSPVRLTDGPATNDRPSWSPDGEWITFRSTRDGKSDIWIMRADGSDPLNLTGAEVFLAGEYNDAPAWSPDGERIAFTRGFGLGQSIVTIRPDGTDLTAVVSAEGMLERLEPAWSPDGTRLAIQTRDRSSNLSHVSIFDPETGLPLSLWQSQSIDAGAPVWLDDQWLAVTARALPGSELRTVALLRATSGHVVVPLAADLGPLSDPAVLRR